MKDIYDVSQLAVLMDHGHPRKEAEKHLKNGTTVYSPREYVEAEQEWCEEQGEPWEERHPISPAEMLSLCQKGEYEADCVESGLYKGDPALPYVIVYVL